MTPIFLDRVANTPIDLHVVEAILPVFTEVNGDASSAHSYGRNAEYAIETARETIAAVLKVTI